MGVDDKLIESSKRKVTSIKKKYDIKKNKLNIVTGGKIDHYKTETLNLMKVVNNHPDVNLYIFGSIGDEIKDEFNSLLSDNVKYVG